MGEESGFPASSAAGLNAL